MEEKKTLMASLICQMLQFPWRGWDLVWLSVAHVFYWIQLNSWLQDACKVFNFVMKRTNQAVQSSLPKSINGKWKFVSATLYSKGCSFYAKTRQRTIVGDEIVIITNSFSSVLHLVKANLMSKTKVTLQPQRRKGRPLNVVNAIVTLPNNKQI
jgi:hypothetical protein